MRWRDEFDLPRRFSRYAPPLVIELLVAIVIIVITVSLRLLIDFFVPQVAPFLLAAPAIVCTALLAGGRAGLITVIACQILSWYFLLPVRHSFALATTGDLLNLLLSTAAHLFVLWTATAYRKAAHFASERGAERAEALSLALGEMDHRTKNNFQIAANLLRLHASRHQDPIVRMELETAAGRIDSIAAAHQNLALSATDISRIDLQPYLNDICNRVRQGLADGIEIVTDLAPAEVERERALQIGLITNELITNSLKHAFPYGAGQIHIHAIVDQQIYVLTISDNGRGAPEISDRKGIGTRLVEMMAKQARTRVRRLPGPGTRYRIELDLPNTYDAEGS